MLYFAVFTVGYFLGVFTFLAIFPPAVREIEEQEKDTLKPTLSISEDKQAEQPLAEPKVSSGIEVVQNF